MFFSYAILSHIVTYMYTIHTFTTHTHIHTYHTPMHTYSQFLMPGLVCCHIHGDQVQNAGANYDKPFFNWLVGDFIRISQQFARNQTYARIAASLIVVCIFCVNFAEIMVTPHCH